MASPAVGMERRYAIDIGVRRVEVLLNRVQLSHADLLIDPGSGTVQQPAAGPSKGQVPQVALDERSETIRHSAGCAATSAAYVPAIGGTSDLGQIALTFALTMEWVQPKPRLFEVGEALIEPRGLVLAEKIDPLTTGQT